MITRPHNSTQTQLNNHRNSSQTAQTSWIGIWTQAAQLIFTRQRCLVELGHQYGPQQRQTLPGRIETLTRAFVTQRSSVVATPPDISETHVAHVPTAAPSHGNKALKVAHCHRQRYR
jgi:hypothetical protein